MACHVRPSWFVRNARRYLSWCRVTRCSDCGLIAKEEDYGSCCMNCGSQSHSEEVGRWVVTKRGFLFGLFTSTEKGYWQIREEVSLGTDSR